MGSAGTYPLWNDEVQFPAVDRIPFPDTITHVAVHRARSDYGFLHGPAIAYHDGTLFANWANSPVGLAGNGPVPKGDRPMLSGDGSVLRKETRVPLLFDTDIGSDIDDALCLAYLLCQSRCELLGITTVTGEPVKRAMLADMLCRHVGRTDIPIYPGAGRPLLCESRQPVAQQAPALDRWPHRDQFPEYRAIEFMKDVIESRPGEITLLAVGPMTNVALLFAQYPETASKLKALIMMCGGANEYSWNSFNDPTAQAIVYATRVAVHLTVGVEITTQCVLPGDRARAEIRSGVLDPVADMCSIWLESCDQVVFHDPLTAAIVFEPELCQYERGVASVELKSDRLAGFTYWDRGDESSPHAIAVGVDVEAFLDHYFRVVKG